MKGYAAHEVFSKRQLRLLRRATELVSRVPTLILRAGADPLYDYVRCHELARAVGHLLKLEVVDGWYGFVEHTWLWTSPPERVHGQMLGPLPDVLDVYMPGHLPQVQLIHQYGSLLLPYRPGIPRDDIREAEVETLTAPMSTRRKRS